DSFSANGSSLLGRSGTLNFGSTVPARRYLRIVLRDSPVRRAISRIGIPSRNAQRRMTLSNAMSITPRPPDPISQGRVQTRVTSQQKLGASPGQFSVEINSYESHWPDRSHPCPSAALLHCSRAASSFRFALIGSGDFGFSSPISTLDASLILILGELSTAGAAVAAEERDAMAETEARRARDCRSRAF